MNSQPQLLEPITEHPILLSWFCALQSNSSYIEQQWQGTGSDFSDQFLQKAQQLSKSSLPQTVEDFQNPQPFVASFSPKDPWQQFLLETFASALLSPKNHSKTLLSLDKGIDRLQISSFNIDEQHIHFVSLRGTESGFLKDTKKAILTYLTEKYTSFKHAASNLIPLSDELLKDPPISSPVFHNRHRLTMGSQMLISPSQGLIQTHSSVAALNLDAPNSNIINPEAPKPLIVFTGHSYGASLAHQMQKHYQSTVSQQALFRSIGFGSPGFGQSTLIQTKSRILNTAQMLSRGLHNLAIEATSYTAQGPWVAMSALVKRFVRALRPDHDAQQHSQIDQQSYELLNSKGRMDFINRFDPVPIIGALAGNLSNDRIGLEIGFSSIFPGLLGKNHKMTTYMRSLTNTVLHLYPPQSVQSNTFHNVSKPVQKKPLDIHPKSQVATEKIDRFLSHIYTQSIDICLHAQQIQHQSTQNAFEVLIKSYPNEDPKTLLEKAQHIGMHSMCSFARGMLLRSGVSELEKTYNNVPEEPTSYQEMFQIDVADLHQEHSMKAALKAFNLRRHLKDATQPLPTPQRLNSF